MSSVERILKPLVWVLCAIIVFEIPFMMMII